MRLPALQEHKATTITRTGPTAAYEGIKAAVAGAITTRIAASSL
jgi:hypothetical protein